MDFLMVMPSLVIALWEFFESKDFRFLLVAALGALWLVPLFRTTYWFGVLLLCVSYLSLFLLSKKRIPWTFWLGVLLLVGSTGFRTYLAVNEPQKPNLWWLLPEKMAQRGSDFANNTDFTRNVAVLLDVVAITLIVFSSRNLSSILSRVFSVSVSYMFVFFLWYPTFEVRLTPSYLDKVLWLIGLIPAIAYVLSVFGKSEPVETDFYFFFIVVYSLFFAPPRGGSFEFALLALIAFPWALLGNATVPVAETFISSGLPPSVGFLFKAAGLASMFITASTVAIVRVYMLFLLVGLCYQIALQSGKKGVLSKVLSVILVFGGVLTGFASRMAVNLYGGSGALYAIENVFNATNTWANVKLDMINMLIPFVIAILASYVFFGEGS